jgi:hypothetical protein
VRKFKEVVEEIVVISFFVCFSGLSLYLSFYGKEPYVIIFAASMAISGAKSATLLFCRLTGLIERHKINNLSYRITAAIILPLWAIALLVKCFSS